MKLSFWGLRHYRRDALPDIIFNRLVHKFGYHFCACRKFIKLNKCYGVVNDDCYLCWDCCNNA